MASYSTSEFKSGMKVLLEGDPCTIMENEFVKPGKGQAFSRVKFRNLKSGRVWERTFKSGESIEAADVMDLDMEYLYNDGEFWHFMRTDGSFEQIAATTAAVGEANQWLKETDVCMVTLWNDDPIAVTPPNFPVRSRRQSPAVRLCYGSRSAVRRAKGRAPKECESGLSCAPFSNKKLREKWPAILPANSSQG